MIGIENNRALDFDNIAEAAKAIVNFADQLKLTVDELSHAATLANAEMSRRYIESLRAEEKQAK